MCRLLGYLGSPVLLEKLIFEPDHSLVVQSYQPQELEGALLNADGFGLGWYGAETHQPPYIYRNILPIWNDANLPELCRYVQTPAMLAYIRSATPGQAVTVNNCQPFRWQNLLFVHNGFIENFRETLYRPLRKRLCDTAYKAIHGTTDSEHIFGLLIHQLETQPGIDLAEAVDQTISIVSRLAKEQNTRALIALIVSTGSRMVAVRHDTPRQPVSSPDLASLNLSSPDKSGNPPSFYYLRGDGAQPNGDSNGVVFASEPLNRGPWSPVPKNYLISVTADLALEQYALSLNCCGSAICRAVRSARCP